MRLDSAQPGPPTLRVMLAADSDAPAAARSALGSMPLRSTRGDVLLLASELVTNAVKHAGLGHGQAIELIAECGAHTTRVEVRDRGVGFAAGGPHSGFGLGMVAFAAERWGIEDDGATCVWFEVPARHLHLV